MSLSIDLRELLKSWPYDPENDARMARGDDGRELLQVRTPLGIEQYEMTGRPDGLRPHEMETALDFHLRRLELARAEGAENRFELDPRECGELFNEGTLYYFRYVRLFQLNDWVRTLRDTTRNLRAFDLVRQYAQRPEDREFLEKWRPYIIRVHASAGAMLEVERRAYDKAITIVNEAVAAIRGMEDAEDETFMFERDRSLTALQDLLSQIQKNRPLSELEQLERQLRRAIERQEFERAAQLRDRIHVLKKQQAC